MNITTTIKGQLIFEWITRNFQPLTWSIMAVKIGDHFLDNGIDPFNLNGNEEFGQPLLLEIDRFLHSYYSKQLPDFKQLEF
ncbi:MAG: hypothetical protein ACOCXH_02355 [Cyclobacteriaceae bacterium]